MDFLRVPLTATVGWLLYSERLDAFTVLGAALILSRKPREPAGVSAGSRTRRHLSGARPHGNTSREVLQQL